MKQPSNAPSGFDFDVALSFADTERLFAEDLARKLEKIGIRAFYDKDHASHLWGKNTEEFEHIYGPGSLFVVPFISKEYVRRDWTKFEFETAKRESRKRPGEFILPVRVDDSRLLGLHDECNYLSLDQYTISEIATALQDKVRARKGAKSRLKPPANIKLLPLTHDERKALGLLVTAVIPMSLGYLTGFFPDIKWRPLLRKFERGGLVTLRSNLIHVSSVAAKAFSDENERDTLSQCWISSLKSRNSYADASLFLSIHFIRRKNYQEAATLLCDVAETLQPGSWLPTFTVALDCFVGRRMFGRVTSDLQLRLLGAAAICHTLGEDYQTACRHLSRLEKLSVKHCNPTCLGNILIHQGKAYSQVGQPERALECYSHSLQIGRDNSVATLVCNALVNLANWHVDSDPNYSLSLLNECDSLSVYKDDAYLELQACATRAIALSELELYDDVFALLDRGDAIADQIGLRLTQCQLLIDRAKTLLRQGKRSAAIPKLKRAIKVAELEESSPHLCTATEMLAVCHFEMNHLEDAKVSFGRLLEIAVREKDEVRAITACHGIGVICMTFGDLPEGKRFLSRALRLSIKAKHNDWALRCVVDSCRSQQSGGLGEPQVNQLKSAATRYEKKGEYELAGQLWMAVGQVLDQLDADSSQVIHAYDQAQRLILLCDNSDFHLVELVERLHVYLWTISNFEAAIEALSSADRFVRSKQMRHTRWAWLHQRGTCLTEMGRHEDGARILRRACRFAEKHDLLAELQTSLHNLGECLSRDERYDEAITVLGEAIDLSKSLGDHESEVSAIHSLAIAMKHSGKRRESIVMLRRCRKVSQQAEFWHEYVRSLAALAVVAWETGGLREAETHFREALKEASRLEVEEQRTFLLVNLASVLRQAGKPKQAIRLLESIAQGERMSPEGHALMRELAEAYEDVDRHLDAAQIWAGIETFAAALGNNEMKWDCISRNAWCHFEAGDRDVAESRLRTLLNDESIDKTCRVETLGHLLGMLAYDTNDRGEEAQRAYDQFCELSLSKDHFEYFIDTHMLLARISWERPDTRLDAMKYYTQAIGAEIRFKNVEDVGEVFCEQLTTILTESSGVKVDAVRELKVEYVEWLRTVSGKAEKLMFLAEPLVIAERLWDDIENPERLSRRMIALSRKYDAD